MAEEVTEGSGETYYKFSVSGLPRYGTIDGNTVTYTYYVSETPLDEYQRPKYYRNGSQVNGVTRIANGGWIANDLIGYELPSTGGIGIERLRAAGIILSALAAGALVFRGIRRRKRA